MSGTDSEKEKKTFASAIKPETSIKRVTLSELIVTWFNGKDEINGKGDGYKAMLNWLKENRDAKIQVCTVFAEKPIQFLATGKTKSNKGDGVAVNDALLQYLPLHEDEELVIARDVAKYGSFIKVNFTMVKRVALYGAEYTNIPASIDWVKRHGGKPSVVQRASLKGTEETIRIKWESITRFRNELLIVKSGT
jgi:hypothetical protein